MKSYPLKMFIKGLVFSAGVSCILFTGMMTTCKYLPWSVLYPAGLIIVCSLLLWTGIRLDRAAEQVDRISSTVAFDFKYSHPGLNGSKRLFRLLVPCIILLLYVLISYVILVAIPSIIVCITAPPEHQLNILPYTVFVVNSGVCVLYFSKIRKEFSSIIEKAFFFAGVVPGQAGAAVILVSYFF